MLWPALACQVTCPDLGTIWREGTTSIWLNHPMGSGMAHEAGSGNPFQGVASAWQQQSGADYGGATRLGRWRVDRRWAYSRAA